MAEIRNNFLKSRMNKDLDARLLPNGEYRDAQNVMISKSEGEDVGALENVLGNISLTDFGLGDISNLEVICNYMDVNNDRIILCITNWVDTSSDRLSNFASPDSNHYICSYNVLTGLSSILTQGYYLNFSKTSLITGVSVIEDLLFFTDNRNQPRKLNITTALSNPNYYTKEDHISVAKYYPYTPIRLYKEQVIGYTLDSGAASNGYPVNVSAYNIRNTTNGGGIGLIVKISTDPGGVITVLKLDTTNAVGYQQGDLVYVGDGLNQDYVILINTEVASTMLDVVSENLPDGTANPNYNQEFKGDAEYLKERFFRFSYRFKFDDNEFSLIAPFTQACFVPEQDGYLLQKTDKNLDRTYKSTEIELMQNKINQIGLIIDCPDSLDWSNIGDNLKVKEVQILSKDSSGSTIRLIDSIDISDISNQISSVYEHIYKSEKPWKTLPSKDLLRVYDQTPVRALAQESVGNRVIYGNYIDKPTPPNSLVYTTQANEKGSLDTDPALSIVKREYQNHTLKQNRSYQAGVVLSDRYGRQSTVLLSILIGQTINSEIEKVSTLFHPYKVSDFSTFTPTTNQGNLASNTDTWAGDSLKLKFYEQITSTSSSITGEPGLYNSLIKPLGWYSYKIVVKQTEHEYYNIYFAGLLNGYIDGESANPLAASADEPVAHLSIYSDNINKLPRDLSLVGPNQNIFRTGRPTYKDDPSYYSFLDSDGNKFTADPYTEEGEAVLKKRDRERDLDSGSQINNASIKLYPRVINTSSSQKQWYPAKYDSNDLYSLTQTDTAVTIGTGTELGLWDPSAASPYNEAPVFYNYGNNPLIAKIEVADSSIGVVGPSQQAGKANYYISSIATNGTEYVAGSKNINTKPVSGTSGGPAGAGEEGSGVIVDINSVDNPAVTGDGAGSPAVGGLELKSSLNIVNKNGVGISGFDNIDWVGFLPSVAYAIDLTVLAGNGDGVMEMTVIRDTWGVVTNMSPQFSVYETKPIESKLDIYWETTSSGLVSELNTAIAASDTTTPYGFSYLSGAATQYSHSEADNIGKNVFKNTIYPTNASGGVLSIGPNTFSLSTVFDGDAQSRINDFTLVQNGEGFDIDTASYFVYNSDAVTAENYTFFVDATVPGENYAVDGLFVTRTIEITGKHRLSNAAPTVAGIAGLINAVSTGGQFSLVSAVNGSYSPTPSVLDLTNYTLKTQELTFNLTSQVDVLQPAIPVNFFYLTSNYVTIPPFPSNAPSINGLNNIDWTPPGDYKLKVEVTDGGNLVDEVTLTVTVA